ncbi:hypothetical protein B0H19DRAFT_1269010 [Mycena capillaripes]|nr:hypothetical protein B0H19DRAFT_1269010 [Mycena capillaripes]
MARFRKAYLEAQTFALHSFFDENYPASASTTTPASATAGSPQSYKFCSLDQGTDEDEESDELLHYFDAPRPAQHIDPVEWYTRKESFQACTVLRSRNLWHQPWPYSIKVTPPSPFQFPSKTTHPSLQHTARHAEREPAHIMRLPRPHEHTMQHHAPPAALRARQVLIVASITANAPQVTAIRECVHPHGASVGVVEPDLEGLIRAHGEKFDLEEEDGGFCVR